MKSGDVLTEQTSEEWYLRKFSIPEVRVGTVIEYRYTITSDYFWDLPTIRVQHTHPVIYSTAVVATPEYYTFSLNTSGHHRINVKRSREVHSGATFNDDVVTITGTDIPSIEDDPLVWCVDDFRTKVEFELRSIMIPGIYYKDFAATWVSVEGVLAENGFLSQLKGGTPLKEEVARITASGGEERERVRAILTLVMSRMNWSDKYSLWSKNLRQRLTEGSGNSADCNATLARALVEGGFSVTPILLNPRRMGRLPYSRPSIDNIRTFVLQVGLSDGSTCVVDATNRANDIDRIPASLMVDRARLYGGEQDGWCDLTTLARARQHMLINCTLSGEGALTGAMTNLVSGTPIYSLRSKYGASEEKYIAALETENNIDISSYAVEGLDGPAVTEKVAFAMESERAGEYLYIGATVVPFMTSSILGQQERRLPIEFSYPERDVVVAMITIPEGWAVEELPQPLNISACDGGVAYRYVASHSGGVISINLDYNLNRSLFATHEYADLRTFFDMMREKNNSRIILKKL